VRKYQGQGTSKDCRAVSRKQEIIPGPSKTEQTEAIAQSCLRGKNQDILLFDPRWRDHFSTRTYIQPLVAEPIAVQLARHLILPSS
jgi:hypothetical protein